MGDHNDQKLSPREMIRAHAGILLQLATTISAVIIAASLVPIARQAKLWEACHDTSVKWHVDARRTALAIRRTCIRHGRHASAMAAPSGQENEKECRQVGRWPGSDRQGLLFALLAQGLLRALARNAAVQIRLEKLKG